MCGQLLARSIGIGVPSAIPERTALLRKRGEKAVVIDVVHEANGSGLHACFPIFSNEKSTPITPKLTMHVGVFILVLR